MTSPPIKSTIFNKATALPPIEVTFLILSNPLEIKKKTSNNQNTPKIPSVCVLDKNEKGGIYSWMEKSVGPRYAFVGIFMWYASYVVWMVNVASTIWIPLSNSIFGKDTTVNWTLFGLSSTQTLGILGVFWLCELTFI